MFSSELKSKNKLFNSLLNAVSEKAIISVTDKHGVITKVNDLFVTISQYDESELIGKTHKVINSGLHEKEFWKNLWNTISSGEIWRGEITNKAKDGSFYVVDTIIYPIEDEDGNIDSFASVRYDITKLKTAEVTLEETDFMLKAMLDSVTDGNVFIGLDYKIHFINNVLLNYCNDFFEDSKIEAGDDIRTKLPKEILNLFLEICEKVKIEKSIKFEREILFQNNEIRCIEFNFNLIQNKGGNPIGIGVFIIDNTKQRKNEREILNTKNLLSSISNSTNQIYFFLDPDKKLMYFNESGRLTLYQTYNRNPTIGENFTDYFDVENLLNDFIECFDKALNGEELKVAKEWENPNGNVLWFNIRYYPVKNEKDEIIGVAINIDEFTQEKKTELELLKFKDLLELTNSNAKIGNWEFNIQTQSVFWTDEVYRIFEIEKDIDDLYLRYLNRLHPNDVELLNSKVDLAINYGESYEIEHRIILKDGSLKFILGNGYPIKNELNETVAIAGTVQDITHRKQLENELYESQLELKAILDSSTESIIFVSPDFKVLSFNKHANNSAQKIFNKELVKNDDFLQFFPPYEIENFKINFSKALNGEKIKIEKKIDFNENIQIWLEVNYYPVKNFENKIIGVSFVVDEISKRKLQEIELLKTKDLLNQSQKIAKLGGWELDIKSGNLLWTDETYRIHETSPEEFNPTVDAGVGYFLPESKATIEKALEEAINQGKGYDLYLETYTTKGNKIDVRTTCEVVFEDEKPSKLRGTFQDISEQKELEKRLNILVSQIDGMVFSITDYPKNQKYWISDGAFELTGYGKEYFYNDNLFFSSLISEEDNLRMRNAMDYCFNTKQPYEVKYKLKHKTKGWIDVLEKGKAKLNEKDEQVTIEGIIIDISNAIQEEKKQKEKEKIFKLITENASDCLVLHDLNGDYVYLSPSSEKVFGYKENELIGNNLKDYLHIEDGKYAINESIVEFLSNETPITLEYRFKHKNGNYIWLEASINIVKEENGNRYIQCVNRNISDRKRYEELLHSAEKLGKIGSWEENLIKNEVVWSQELHNMLGTNEKDLKNKKIKFLDFVHPEDKDFLIQTFENSIKYKSAYEIIFRLLIEDKIKYVKETWQVVTDSKDKAIKIVGSIIDITEMYELQQGLVKLNDHLENKIQERTKELNESLKEKEILLDEIHHRVKNNLQVVIGLMNMQQNTLGDEQTKFVLKESERRVRAMSLIHELIYQKKNYKEIVIQDYVVNLYNYIAESFSDKHVILKTEIENVSLSISTATSLGIILTEIITNSFKYAFQEFNSEKIIFIKLVQANEDNFVLLISDNGQGFLTKRDSNSPKTLGMILISGLVQQLKGKLNLKSDSNGTEYNIEFTDNKK